MRAAGLALVVAVGLHGKLALISVALAVAAGDRLSDAPENDPVLYAARYILFYNDLFLQNAVLVGFLYGIGGGTAVSFGLYDLLALGKLSRVLIDGFIGDLLGFGIGL